MTTNTNAKAATALATIQISRLSLLGNQPRPDVAIQVHPEAVEQGERQARAVYDACVGLAYVDMPRDRDGQVALCRVARDGRSWFTGPGNTLKGIVRSALMSAFFESEAAARAWNRFVEAEDRTSALNRHEEDVAREAGSLHSGDDGNRAAEATSAELETAAQRAMDAVAQAAVMLNFAAELARLVEEAGDGELVQVEYTPRARADGTGRTPAPRAAANLRQMMRGS